MSSMNDPFGAFSSAQRWYVYLLPTSDSSCFKVGFTRHPLQRIYSFNSRYFEYFDLRRAVLLPATSEAQARATEARIKKQFASFSIACPQWVRDEAGGHTEWFGIDQFSLALERSLDDIELQAENAFDLFRAALRALTNTFEAWACAHATALHEDIESAQLGYERRVRSEPLRDWVDAYRHFDIELYVDDEKVRRFVHSMAASSGRR